MHRPKASVHRLSTGGASRPTGAAATGLPMMPSAGPRSERRSLWNSYEPSASGSSTGASLVLLHPSRHPHGPGADVIHRGAIAVGDALGSARDIEEVEDGKSDRSGCHQGVIVQDAVAVSERREGCSYVGG